MRWRIPVCAGLIAWAFACRNPTPSSHVLSRAARPDAHGIDLVAPIVERSAPDAPAPSCVHAPPGPCEERAQSAGDHSAFVRQRAFEAGHVSEERDYGEHAPELATIRRYHYDAAGHLVREDDFRNGELTFVVHYRRDAHDNITELRAGPTGGPERVERHVLVLDAHGRVQRDDLYARPDGDIYGHRPDQLPVRHLHWTTYDRDANGAVMVSVEQDARGPYHTIRYERDEHGTITHAHIVWSRGEITDERYRQSYDTCGNLVLTERLRNDGTVRGRVEFRYDCGGGRDE